MDLSTDSQPAGLATIKKPYKHACERCRNLKLKCTTDRMEATGTCDRCTRAKERCIFEPLGPRQRRKRTDARVTSLEKELSALRSKLGDLKDSQIVDSSLSPLAPRIAANKISGSFHGKQAANAEPFLPDLLPDGLAIQLFSNFLEVFLLQYPVVVIPESFDSLRTSKPLLLLAAITAASSAHDPHLFGILHSYLARQVIDKTMIDGDRSLELIQSILILGTWYYPPNDLQRLNFYQWFHIAGTMALQLDLGGKTSHQVPDFYGQKYENQRTMLTVYQSCSSVAMSLRRQSMISFPYSAQQCLVTFEVSADSYEDKRLIAWLKLQLIAEDLEKERSQTLLEEAIRRFNNGRERYEQWERTVEPNILDTSLIVHYQYCKARLFESILYRSQRLEELVPPFLSCGGPPELDNGVVSPSYVRAVIALVACCHSILQTVISTEDVLLRSCPTITFARSLYALKVLSTLRQALCNPEQSICRIIDDESLRFGTFTGALIDKLKAASGKLKCRVPMMILQVALKIAGQSPDVPLAEHANHSSEAGYGDDPSRFISNAMRASRTLQSTENRSNASSLHGPEQPSFVDSSNSTQELSKLPSSTPPSTPAVLTGSLDMQGYSDIALLSDFDAMFMPELSLGLHNMYDGSEWPQSPFAGD